MRSPVYNCKMASVEPKKEAELLNGRKIFSYSLLVLLLTHFTFVAQSSTKELKLQHFEVLGAQILVSNTFLQQKG